MPASWGTLYELTKLTDDQFDRGLKKGIIHPDMQRNHVDACRSEDAGDDAGSDGKDDDSKDGDSDDKGNGGGYDSKLLPEDIAKARRVAAFRAKAVEYFQMVGYHVEQAEKTVPPVPKPYQDILDKKPVEWFAPPGVAEMARECMDNVPASNYLGSDGASTFVYPPWNAIPKWVKTIFRGLDDKTIKQAIMLLPAHQENDWFLATMNYTTAICYPKGDGKGYDPMLLYFGQHPEEFEAAFAKMGRIEKQRQNPQAMLKKVA